MKITRQFRWVILLIMTAFAGCSGQQIQPTATAWPAPPTATEMPVTDTPTSVPEEATMTPTPSGRDLPNSAKQSLIGHAKADLAARLDVNIEEIEVVEFRAVTWRDSSLGCPEPGMAYMQVLSDGSLIRLEAEGSVYEYHSGRSRQPFLCKNPGKPLPPSQLPGAGFDDK